MFTLKIHAVDQTQQQRPNTKSKKKLFNPTEIKGVVHLFRNLRLISSSSSTSSVNLVMKLWNVATRTINVFIVAVPNYLSYDDFLAFCGSHVDRFQDLSFIRNDAVEDRYSVLIKLKNQAAADAFCDCYGLKFFSPPKTEVCHIYFAQAVEYTDSAEVASIPQTGYTELPTCPVCLERLDYDTSAIHIKHCGHSFQCSCITKWAYLSCQVCQLCQQQDGKTTTCAVCGISDDTWVCLICGFVGCGRYEKGHAVQHYRHADHCYTLKPETKKIWDYVNNKYVNRLELEEGLPNNVSSPQSDIIRVQGYQVKNINAPILEAIFKKHGDIAAECVFKTPCVRESFLEVICEVVKRIETNDVRTIIYMLEEIDCQVSEAKAANINVSWLQPHLEAIQKKNKAEKKSSLLMEMKVDIILVKRAAKTDLIERSLELAAAQKCFENAERCVNVLDLVENKLNDNILESNAEKDSWVKQPIV